jgi:hypothetical protein
MSDEPNSTEKPGIRELQSGVPPWKPENGKPGIIELQGGASDDAHKLAEHLKEQSNLPRGLR